MSHPELCLEALHSSLLTPHMVFSAFIVNKNSDYEKNTNRRVPHFYMCGSGHNYFYIL